MAKDTQPKKDKTTGQAKPKKDKSNTLNLFGKNTEANESVEFPIRQDQIIKEEISTPPKNIDLLTHEPAEQPNNFSIKKAVYLPIHKANLLQYITAGIIFPNKYSKQKAFSDPQSINEEALLLSNRMESTNGEIIYLHLDPDGIELSHLHLSQEIAFYAGAIPISCIIAIHVANDQTVQKLINDAMLRDAGFIPERLFVVSAFHEINSLPNRLNIDIAPVDLNQQLSEYDRILGLIQGVQNFSILNSNGIIKSISDHTFYALQAIDPDFAKEHINSNHVSDFYRWLFNNSCPEDRVLLNWIFNRVRNDTNFTDVDTKEFEDLCFQSDSFIDEIKEAKTIFFSLNRSMDRNKALSHTLKLNSKNSLALYIFSYLRIYGTKQNPEQARIDLATYGANKYSEYAFAVLHFFFGYKLLRNTEDKLKQNPELSKIIKPKPAIKVELACKYDYLILDIVFNFSFGRGLNFSKNNYSQNIDNQNTNIKYIGNYKDTIIKVYEKEYHVITVVPDWEQYPMLEKLPDEISIFSDIGLLCYRSGLNMEMQNFFTVLKNPHLAKTLIYFSKNDLKDAINQKRIDRDELKERILLAEKYKEKA